MNTLEFVLNTKPYGFEIGQEFASVNQTFSDLSPKCTVHSDLDRTHLKFGNCGFEMLFESGILDSVFLYLASNNRSTPLFSGHFNLLDDDFFQTLSVDKFCKSMCGRGFTACKTSYPFAVDFVSSNLRIRLETRSDQTIILIDDGSMIREF